MILSLLPILFSDRSPWEENSRWLYHLFHCYVFFVSLNIAYTSRKVCQSTTVRSLASQFLYFSYSNSNLQIVYTVGFKTKRTFRMIKTEFWYKCFEITLKKTKLQFKFVLYYKETIIKKTTSADWNPLFS